MRAGYSSPSRVAGAAGCRDGDVYVGSRWNTLSILYAFFFFTPLLGLLFAWATYGTLWATGTYY